MSKIIAVDFDGTLCTNAYPEIGEPLWPIIHYIKSSKENGDKIILWTCRADERLTAALEWCKVRGLVFDAVNENLPEVIEAFGGDTRKIFAHQYLDDKMPGFFKFYNDLYEAEYMQTVLNSYGKKEDQN